jgi:hypothetical protein
MVTLSAWERGSHLYGPQELEVYFYPTEFEYVAVKMARVDKDYELEVHYHPGKANAIADVLSHKAHCNYLPVVRLIGEESSTRVLLDLSLYNITLMPILRDEIIAAQKNDKGMAHIKRRMEEGDLKVACFCEDVEGTLWFKESLVVPKKEALKKKVMYEAHTSRYSILLGSTKMYHDLRQQFLWTRMKREIALLGRRSVNEGHYLLG